MTITEAERIVAGITIGAGVGMWRTRMAMTRASGDHWSIKIACDVPHRDSDVGVVGLVVSDSVSISKHDIDALDRGAFIHFLLTTYLGFVRHEALEGFKIDGQLVKDPHVP